MQIATKILYLSFLRYRINENSVFFHSLIIKVKFGKSFKITIYFYSDFGEYQKL